MSTIQAYTTATRPSAVGNTGLTIFNTTSKDINVSDGTSWRAYANDGVSIVLGASTHSLALDGTDDRMECGDVSGISSVTAFSVSAWFRTSSTATMYLLSGVGSATDPSAFYDGFQVYISGGKPYFVVGNGASKYDGANNTTTVNDDDWHHVVGVMNGSTYTVYVDGSTVGSTNIGDGTVSTTHSTCGGNFTIGERFDSNNTYAFNGYVDDVAVFNRALTSSEVSNIYNNADYLSPINLWKMDDSTDDLVGSNNGTLQANADFTDLTKRT